ncbi:MAG: hypothetical protein GWP07_05615 [Xanthomonadaceae bacterium]|nr:hypothetical protein [Xanthomonadaceae bacterium]
MSVSSRMLSFFILSIFIHTLLIVTLPDVSRFFDIPLLKVQLLPETEVEVTLMRPVRKPLPLSAAKSVTDKKSGDKKKISTLIENRIAEIIALGEMPVPAPENIDLPASVSISPDTIRVVKMTPLPSDKVPELIADIGTLQPGIMAGTKALGSLPADYVGEKQVASERQLINSLQQTLKKEKVLAKVKNRLMGLEGPIAESRIVVFQPGIPQVSLNQATDVKLKFWVRSDGTVGRVEPVIIGDLSLVKSAEIYMKAWRFNTLSPDVPQTEQWGTITIRFTLQK